MDLRNRNSNWPNAKTWQAITPKSVTPTRHKKIVKLQKRAAQRLSTDRDATSVLTRRRAAPQPKNSPLQRQGGGRRAGIGFRRSPGCRGGSRWSAGRRRGRTRSRPRRSWRRRRRRGWQRRRCGARGGSGTSRGRSARTWPRTAAPPWVAAPGGARARAPRRRRLRRAPAPPAPPPRPGGCGSRRRRPAAGWCATPSWGAQRSDRDTERERDGACWPLGVSRSRGDGPRFSSASFALLPEALKQKRTRRSRRLRCV